MTKFVHIFLWLMLIGVLFAMIGMVIIAYWLFWPYKTLEVKNFSYTAPIHIETPVVHPGDTLKYDFDYCKYIDAPAIVYRTLVDGQTIPLAPKEGNVPQGCRHLISEGTAVPETINPGRYYLDVVIYYKPNPIRRIAVHYYTEYFQVVEPDMPSTSEPPAAQSTKLIPPIPVVDPQSNLPLR